MKRSGLSFLFLFSAIFAANAHAALDSALIDRTRTQVESHRISSAPVAMKLKDAPYPKYLIYTQIGEIYPALFADEWEKLTTKPPLDLLFDELIKMILNGTVPASMQDDVKAIGPRLAKNVQKGAGPNCVLDTSDRIVKVPTSALLALKLDVANLISNCTYRKRIFNKAKPELIKARKDPKVLAILKKQAAPIFPAKFEEEFSKTIGGKIRSFPELVVAKFGGEMHPIWGDGGSIVDPGPETPVVGGKQQIVTLEQFGRGLRVDLENAAILIQSPSKKDKGLAAGLFYAAMNRLIMLTGGKQIVLTANGLKINPPTPSSTPIILSPTTSGTEAAAADMPKAVVPNIAGMDFGGWGVEMRDGKPVMSAWDWEGYDPDRDTNPTAYRMIPSRFMVDENGIGSILDEKDLVLTNTGIAEMLSALSAFVKYTAPDAAFGKFFGNKDQVSDLLDAKKPLLFPKEGRLFALAILNGLAQNLMEANRGHVQMLINPKDETSVDTTGKGVWPKFRDRSTFTSVQEKKIDVTGLAHLLRGAEDLRLNLLNDAELKTLEPKVEEVAVQVQNLVQFGVLEIGYKSQLPDGSFTRFIYGSDETQGDILASIEVLTTFVKMYNSTVGEFFYLRIPDGWNGLAALLPGARLDPYTADQLRKLWIDTQLLVPQHKDFKTEDLMKWESAVRSVISL